jgi:hypothetical protein
MKTRLHGLCKAQKGVPKDKRNQCRTELARGCSAPRLNAPASAHRAQSSARSSCLLAPGFRPCMCKRRQNNNGGFFSQKRHAKEMQSSCSVDDNLHPLLHPSIPFTFIFVIGYLFLEYMGCNYLECNFCVSSQLQ